MVSRFRVDGAIFQKAHGVDANLFLKTDEKIAFPKISGTV